MDTARYVLTEPQADAVALLDELGLGSVQVVGHDWGAQVAWRLAAEQPDRVRTLTAISLPHPRALTTALKTMSVNGSGWAMCRCCVPPGQGIFCWPAPAGRYV